MTKTPTNAEMIELANTADELAKRCHAILNGWSEALTIERAAESTGSVRVESESSLTHRVQLAISRMDWEIGECASIWMKRYARGRTEKDFSEACGINGAEQFNIHRRVWERFGDVYLSYPELRWSHFHVALDWNDWQRCLQWAQDVGATVAEMKAWRRAQNGEDLRVSEEL